MFTLLLVLCCVLMAGLAAAGLLLSAENQGSPEPFRSTSQPTQPIASPAAIAAAEGSPEARLYQPG